MRLIDADELIKGRVENDPVRIAAMCAPTAFNKREAKWELIKARTVEAYKTDFANRSEAARSEGRYSAFSEAIRIIEKGGLE